MTRSANHECHTQQQQQYADDDAELAFGNEGK